MIVGTILFGFFLAFILRLLRWRKSGWAFAKYAGRGVMMILTVAHLDGDLVDHSDENLRHWCQLHHNRHDGKSRAANAAITRDTKVGQGRLL